jgi:4'-phosphopantetheinyl transferase
MLDPGDAHAWCLSTESREADALAADFALLSASEKARAARFAFDADRRDYIAAHALLRRSLSRCLPCPPAEWAFAGEAHEKPTLAPSDASPLVSFNLSHARGLVGCVIATGSTALGIDIERTDRIAEASLVADRCFSAQETSALARCSSNEQRLRFAELWTLKEAFVKALGVGLSASLSNLSFDLDRPGEVVFTPPPDLFGVTWQFAVFAPTDRHVMAVAAPFDPAGPLRLRAAWAEDDRPLIVTRASLPPGRD